MRDSMKRRTHKHAYPYTERKETIQPNDSNIMTHCIIIQYMCNLHFLAGSRGTLSDSMHCSTNLSLSCFGHPSASAFCSLEVAFSFPDCRETTELLKSKCHAKYAKNSPSNFARLSLLFFAKFDSKVAFLTSPPGR